MLKKCCLLTVIFHLLFISSLWAAKNISSIYDDDTLRYWQPLNREDILWNYENVIFPKLTDKEQQKLRGVTILFPLRGAHPNDIFGFYANHAQNTIYIPILSVRFFSDIALAQAWLLENGYNISTGY